MLLFILGVSLNKYVHYMHCSVVFLSSQVATQSVFAAPGGSYRYHFELNTGTCIIKNTLAITTSYHRCHQINKINGNRRITSI